MKKTAILLAFLLFPALAAADVPPAPPAALPLPPAFRHESLDIQTAKERYHYTVEIAETRQQQEYGLMHRKTLAGDRGMLFVSPGDINWTMWMKDTDLPLDMLFIDRTGKIVHIAQRTTPYSTDVISAGRPLRAVLELLGGTAARRGIRVGDKVISSYFKP